MELGFWNHGTEKSEPVPELWNQGWN